MKIGATLRYSPLDQAARWFGRFLPKGLYARALIIIIAPVILLQSVVAYVFMERHYQLVTRRLSSAVTADIAALIDIYESYPQDKDASTLSRIASERLQLDVDILRNTDLPPPGPKPFFDILDETLTLLRSRGYSHLAVPWGDAVLVGVAADLHYLTAADIAAAWDVFRRFADKDWSFTDCTSKVVVEALGVTTAFSFDQHFRQFGTVSVVP